MLSVCVKSSDELESFLCLIAHSRTSQSRSGWLDTLLCLLARCLADERDPVVVSSICYNVTQHLDILGVEYHYSELFVLAFVWVFLNLLLISDPFACLAASLATCLQSVQIITQHDYLQQTTPSYSNRCVLKGIPRQYKTVQSGIVCQFHLIIYWNGCT
jgi:hypothetical protein